MPIEAISLNQTIDRVHEVLAAEVFAQPERLTRLPSKTGSSQYHVSPTSSLILSSPMSIARRSPTGQSPTGSPSFMLGGPHDPDSKSKKTSHRDSAPSQTSIQARIRPLEEIAKTNVNGKHTFHRSSTVAVGESPASRITTKRNGTSTKISTLAASGEAILRQQFAPSSTMGKQVEQRVEHTVAKSKPGSQERATIGPPSGQEKQVRPPLLLPLQPRSYDAPGPPSSASPPPIPPPTFRVTSPAIIGGRAPRPSSRLIALDDQTSIARHVYDRMMEVGEQARGARGYGQHKLGFKPTDGAPVLRRMDTIQRK